MRAKFCGNSTVQKGNKVEAIVGGRKYVGKVEKVTGAYDNREVVIAIEDGNLITVDNFRRIEKSNAEKKREYMRKQDEKGQR